MKIFNDITEIIGATPLIRINNISDECEIELFAKCEFMNPSGSIKDRVALSMINCGMESGKITNKTTIIEPTSGNTGIGLASICAIKKINLILTMPDSMSLERRQILLAFGAKLVLTPAIKGMQGSIDKAKELQKEMKNSCILQQFENIDNVKAHYKTADEILEAMNNKIDVLVCGVGTGGSLTGIASKIKKTLDIKVVAVEPKASPMLSEGKNGLHNIQGIGAGFVPKILDKNLIDEVVCVGCEESIEETKELALSQGLLVGISSGANIVGVKKISHKYKGARIVTLLPDSGFRYLSDNIF
jgi:cysteine synthase A